MEYTELDILLLYQLKMLHSPKMQIEIIILDHIILQYFGKGRRPVFLSLY